jgi:hypothetical protein
MPRGVTLIIVFLFDAIVGQLFVAALFKQAELLFLRNLVTPEPVNITPDRKSAARTPSLSPFRTFIKSPEAAAASYPATIA